MVSAPDSVTYQQSVSEQVGASEVADWLSTFRPANPWTGMIGYATDLDTFEFRIASAWRHPAWIEGAEFVGPVNFGPTDYQRVQIFPQGLSTDMTGSSQTMWVRRVGSPSTAAGPVDTFVNQSSWVLTDTTAPAGVRFTNLVTASSGAGVDPGEVWGFLSTMGTQASTASRNHVAGYFQALRNGLPGAGVGVPVEGLVVEARDKTGVGTASAGKMRTLELDLYANGADDFVGVGREVVPIVLGKHDTLGTSPTIKSLIGVYPVSGDGVSLTRGLGFYNSLAFTQSLFDSRDAVQGGSANAMWLKSGQRIALDGDSTTLNTASTNYIFHGSNAINVSGTLVANSLGAAPITLSSGIISVPASQSLSVRTSTAGQTITFGAPSAGTGNVATITPNTNGNSFFGAAPNDLTVTNRLSVGQLQTTGNTFALSGTVTPTAFSGTGATATVTFAAISGIVIPVGSTVTVSGATPAGYNGTFTVTASTNTTVSFASSATGALSVAGSMAYNMAAPRILSLSSNWSGTPSLGTQFYPYTMTIPTDTADTGATGSGAPLMYLAHNWGGAAKGSKGGLRIALTHTSATNDPSVGSISQQHVVGEWWGATAYNAGGTGNNTLAAGSFYGMNPQILLQQGATYWRLANAMGEANLAVYASSQTLTIGGTPAAGDTVTVTFTSADISGSPLSLVWTVGASQTTAMVANSIASLIWSNTALQNAKVSASVSGSVVKLLWYTHIASLTVTTGKTGTVTSALGSVTGGASVDIKVMGSFIRLAEDSAPGSLNSAFLLLSAQPGSGTAGLFNNGIVFGGITGYNGEWSWHKGSTLIGANPPTSYGGAGLTHPLVPTYAQYGIDFSEVAFSGNSGASIRVPGFQIASDTTGAVYIGGAKIANTSSGLLLDSSGGATASAVALSSGGGGGAGVAVGNYFAGDVGFDAYGGAYRVDTVNASTGAVATFTVLVYPSYQSGAAPANPQAVSFGSGTGWTVNITWPTNPGITVQAASGKVGFFGATPIVKPTGVAVTAAGVHAALVSLGLIAP